MTNIIQGNDAVLSFFKEGWVPFMCASDISISLTSDTLPIRTPGDGHWKKIAYQNAGFAVTLSGLLIFDEDNWTGFDMMDNWLNFTEVLFMCSFSDANGDTTSIQGSALVTTNTLSIAAGALVKNDFDLAGNGPLMIFDGLIPCDSTIETISVAGQTASDGIVHVTYTYSGAPYQVKYQVDGIGNYVYALADITLDIPSLSLGSHSIELVPVCLNGYEGIGLIQAFVVTQGLTCSGVVTGITISGNSATPVYTGTPTTYKYSMDGGAWVYVSSITTPVGLGGLSTGSHSLNIVPICSNGVEGTGFTQAFSYTQPLQSTISFTFSNEADPSNYFQIYVNSILNQNLTASGSGSIVVANGSVIKSVLISGVPAGGRAMTLLTVDSTTSTTIDTRSSASPATLQYSFTASGDDYSLTGTISP